MFKKVIRNYFLYTFAFFLSLYYHKGTITPNASYDLYYAAFMISWAIASLLSRKFKVQDGYRLLNKLYTYTVSFFLMLGILSIIIYYFDLIGVSRFVILTSLIMSFSVEISYKLYKEGNKISLKNFKLKYSTKAFVFEVLLFGITNLYIIYNIENNLSFDQRNVIIFVNLYLSWFLGSFIGHQFYPQHQKKIYWVFIWQYLKSYVVILALSLFSGFIIRMDLNEIVTIIYGILTYSFLSFTGISIYFHIKKHRILSLNITSFQQKGEIGEVLLKEINPIKQDSKSRLKGNDSILLNSKFKSFSLMKYPEVYEFMNESIDLGALDYSYSVIIKSDKISNIDYIPDRNVQLLVNLERFNRVRDINEYFSEVNNKLVKDGIFAGNFETIYLRHQRFFKRYPYYFAQIFYFMDFLWNRVLLKISILKLIYLKLKGEPNKAISLAEGLGRLYYNGFEVLNLKIIKNTIFFIAKKIKEPIKDESPSTGLIFKMKRTGIDGKLIYIYKIRTMHPYSEYLQEFIYKKFYLEEGGKFKNDFRITYWGAILRKLWLDELPMLYNLFKGDLKLIGPRPLSQHYFNLYNQDLKKRRVKYKPGLIPPFYVDNPKTFTEIMSSEQKYIDLYEKDPIRTDIKYFFQCIHNILFKGSRSS